MAFAVVDQRRATNARRILRMGGAVAGDTVTAEVSMPADEDPRTIRDASGNVIRRL